MNNKYLVFVSLVFFMFNCKEESLPKPEGQIRLEYPKPEYLKLNSNCPFTLERSNLTRVRKKSNECWFDISYPKMKGNIHLTYQKVNGDLANKIKESERLAHEHSVKASFIDPKIFENSEKKVYGTLFELGGASAVNFRFHVTDSTNHILSGSVYFETPPNPDSLQPAIQYIKQDVQHLMESVEWK